MRTANLGWVGLAAYVISYDVWAMKRGNETLSSCCYRAYQHPLGKWAVVLGTAVTVKHLIFPKFMPKADPYGLIALAIRGTEKVERGKRILGLEP